MADYEVKRRERLLALAIDQCITGMRNIVTFSKTDFWRPEDSARWINIKDNAEEILFALLALEQKLSTMYEIQNANPGGKHE